MNKTGWTIVIVVIALALVGGLAYAHLKSKDAAGQEGLMTGPETAGMTGTTTDGTSLEAAASLGSSKTVTVAYSDQGFAPASVSLGIGDTVRFVNQSSHPMWVASDAHPTHTEFDGTSRAQHCTDGADNNGSFDECSAVDAGGSYDFTFSKAGTFEYHNHARATDTGTVIVQ